MVKSKSFVKKHMVDSLLKMSGIPRLSILRLLAYRTVQLLCCRISGDEFLYGEDDKDLRCSKCGEMRWNHPRIEIPPEYREDGIYFHSILYKSICISDLKTAFESDPNLYWDERSRMYLSKPSNRGLNVPSKVS